MTVSHQPLESKHAALRGHIDLLVILIVGGLLVTWPQLDLTVTGLFYRAETGFWLKAHPLVRFIYDLVPWISRAILAGLVLFLLGGWLLFRGHAGFARRRRATTYLLLVALVGPLLLVNGIFKEHWGRARPSQVVEFGGTREFTRAAVPADQCAKNCSFVSGHASVGFFFLALAFADPRRRARWLALGTGLGLGIGLVRMLQGGHFLSDVVFAGIVVYLTARGLRALMLRAPRESRA
jgi:lipid A 4'-phosphatase